MSVNFRLDTVADAPPVRFNRQIWEQISTSRRYTDERNLEGGRKKLLPPERLTFPVVELQLYWESDEPFWGGEGRIKLGETLWNAQPLRFLRFFKRKPWRCWMRAKWTKGVFIPGVQLLMDSWKQSEEGIRLGLAGLLRFPEEIRPATSLWFTRRISFRVEHATMFLRAQTLRLGGTCLVSYTKILN